MLLVENDKRGPEYSISLTYSDNDGSKFYIPDNLYIIGMMNTADRSLAMVDYALRRRFVFYTLVPQFHSEKFKSYLSANGVSERLVEKIINRFSSLNDTIAGDEKYLGSGYKIGHSYFCPDSDMINPNDEWYNRVIQFEIEPLLKEYWFDNLERAENVIENLL